MNNKDIKYGRVAMSIGKAVEKLPQPRGELKGKGSRREVFFKAGRWGCDYHYVDMSVAEHLFWKSLPDAHKSFVRAGLSDLYAVVSPEAMACWKTHRNTWNRLSSARYFLQRVSDDPGVRSLIPF